MSFINPESISFEQVCEFLKEKDATGVCHACGSSELGVSYSSTESAALTLTKNGTPEHSYPVAMVICKDCGFLQLHALGAVSKWLARTSG